MGSSTLGAARQKVTPPKAPPPFLLPEVPWLNSTEPELKHHLSLSTSKNLGTSLFSASQPEVDEFSRGGHHPYRQA
jgi:hypothetical protein